MLNLVEITRGEFRDQQQNYDVVIGEKESCSCFYNFTCKYGSTELIIGIIHNYPNMGLDPQIELMGNKLIVGNNESLTIVNLETKERNDYPIFPVFNKFFIYENMIVVMSELAVWGILDDKVLWSLNDFGDMIFYERLEKNKLIVSTYEDKKEIAIDINTGQIL